MLEELLRIYSPKEALEKAQKLVELLEPLIEYVLGHSLSEQEEQLRIVRDFLWNINPVCDYVGKIRGDEWKELFMKIT